MQRTSGQKLCAGCKDRPGSWSAKISILHVADDQNVNKSEALHAVCCGSLFLREGFA